MLKIAFAKENDYRVHFSYMSKYEAMNIIKNSDLKEKSGTLQNKTIFVNMYIKIDKKNCGV